MPIMLSHVTQGWFRAQPWQGHNKDQVPPCQIYAVTPPPLLH